MAQPLALIIEDDPQLSQIFSIALRDSFEVMIFPDGRMAMDQLASLVPRLIILDLNLPGIPGREILQKIRSDGRLSNVRVILTTADDRQAELLEDQADVILLKPVSPAQLRELATRLGRPKAQ